MKKVVGALLAMGLILGVASTAVAELPGGGWWSPFQIQNVGDDTANVTYTARTLQGQAAGTYTQSPTEITVPVGSSVTYNPALAPNYPTGTRVGFDTADDHLPSGFAGGVEIASDQPLRAVVTVNNFVAGTGVGVSGGRASAYYQSVQEPGTQINFPVMKHDYYGQTTTFYIQAAGGDATIEGTFASGSSTYPFGPINIDAGRSYMLDPSAASVPASTLGSLTVEATSGQIAGVIIEAQDGVSVGTFALATKGFGPGDADTVIVAPTNKTRYFNGLTGWQLQNTTALSATVAVTFTVSGVAAGSPAETAGIAVGDQFRSDVEIDPSGSYLFSVPNGNYYAAVEVGGTQTLEEGLFFSGLAVSDQPLVATVNEANGGNRIVYSAFGANNATGKLAAPAVKEMFFNQRTSLNVQNVGDASTTPVAVYSCAGVEHTVTAYKAIGPGEAINFFMLSDATHPANGWGSEQVPAANNCAVTVTASEPIVAVAQESITTGAQDIKNYEGFNLAP